MTKIYVIMYGHESGDYGIFDTVFSFECALEKVREELKTDIERGDEFEYSYSITEITFSDNKVINSTIKGVFTNN